MFRSIFSIAAAFGLLFWALGSAQAPLRAQGQCANCDLPPGCRGEGNKKNTGNGRGRGNGARNCQRLEITIESDIDFGRLVLLGDGGGRVVLDLSTGQKYPSGDIDDLGGMPVTGRAVIRGAPFEEVVVDLPSEIAMRDPNRGNARLRDFESDLPGFPRLDSDGQLAFHFSGTLVIDADTLASGTLRGRVPITVEYP